MTLVETVSLIGGLLAILVGLKMFYKIEKDAEAVAARCTELEKKLRKSGEDYTDALNGVRNYYDEKIERQENEIKALNHGIDVSVVKINKSTEELHALSDRLGAAVEDFNSRKGSNVNSSS